MLVCLFVGGVGVGWGWGCLFVVVLGGAGLWEQS